MDCSPPCSSSVHGILQARILEWVAIPLSRGSSRLRDQTQVSCIEGRFFSHLSHQGNPLHIKPFAFCTAPQSSFLSARLDSAWFMNHCIKPLRYLNFVHLTFFFCIIFLSQVFCILLILYSPFQIYFWYFTMLLFSFACFPSFSPLCRLSLSLPLFYLFTISQNLPKHIEDWKVKMYIIIKVWLTFIFWLYPTK